MRHPGARLQVRAQRRVLQPAGALRLQVRQGIRGRRQRRVPRHR